MSSGALYVRKADKQFGTTAAAFKDFARFVRQWLAVLGLQDWDVEFEHVFLEGRFASCHNQPSSRKATIALSTCWGSWRPTTARLRRSALHETSHLLLADLWDAAERRYVTLEELHRAEEAVVTRVVNALLPPPAVR